MRVLFLYPNLPGVSGVSVGLGLFTAILRNAGHDVELFNTTNYSDLFGVENIYKFKSDNLNARSYDESVHDVGLRESDVRVDFKNKVDAFRPDLIAVSCTEDMYIIAKKILEFLGGDHPPIVAGGVFPTFAAELILRETNVTYVIRGEGEYSLLELCNNLELNIDVYGISGLCYIKDGQYVENLITKPVDVLSLPLPDYSLFEDSVFYRPMQGKIWRMLPISTIRGCPYSCAYCNAPATRGVYKDQGYNFFRKSRIESVYSEIKNAIEKYKADSFYFWAETFLSWSNSEFEEFCEMYSEFKLPFWIQTRAETVSKEKMIKLKDLGLLRAGFGIEHGDEAFRIKYLARKTSNEMIINNINIVTDLKIPISVNAIVGFPMEDRDLAFSTIELTRKIKSDGINSFTFIPFHGSALRKLAIEKGFLEKNTVVNSVFGRSPLDMPNFSVDEIEGIRRCFVLYAQMPRKYWPEIRKAEALTPEGDAVHAELSRICLENYMNYGDFDE